MLIVKTKLSASSIHGIGLYAEEFIPKGTKVWEFHQALDKMYTKDEIDSFDDLGKNFLNMYCYRYKSNYYLCVDDSRFFNHSFSPNCTDVIEHDDNIAGGGYTYALRDIHPGEELTCDYRRFGHDEEDLAYNMEWLVQEK